MLIDSILCLKINYLLVMGSYVRILFEDLGSVEGTGTIQVKFMAGFRHLFLLLPLSKLRVLCWVKIISLVNSSHLDARRRNKALTTAMRYLLYLLLLYPIRFIWNKSNSYEYPRVAIVALVELIRRHLRCILVLIEQISDIDICLSHFDESVFCSELKQNHNIFILEPPALTLICHFAALVLEIGLEDDLLILGRMDLWDQSLTRISDEIGPDVGEEWWASSLQILQVIFHFKTFSWHNQ